MKFQIPKNTIKLISFLFLFILTACGLFTIFQNLLTHKTSLHAATAVTVEQQINLLDTPVSGGGSQTASIATIDTASYSNATYYLEVVADIPSGSGTVTFTYNAGTGSTPSGGSTLTISGITSTTYARYRSSSFTPTGSQNVYISTSTGASMNVIAARVIIIQTGPAITSTETNIEIGNSFSGTGLTDGTLSSPKYWTYNAAKYDGTVQVFFEASIRSGTAGDSGSASLYPSGTTCSGQVTGSEVTSDTTGNVYRVRSANIAANLTSGSTYMVCMRANTGGTATMRNAHLIIQQTSTSGITKYETQLLNANTHASNNTSTYVSQGYLNNYDPTHWTGGTFTNYYEANIDTSGSTGFSQLYNITDSTAIASSEISTTSTTNTNIVTSGSLTMPTSAKDLDIQIKNSTTNTTNIRGAWLKVDVTNLPLIPNAPASLTQKTVGGNLGANTYYYQVTAGTTGGETTAAAVQSVSASGTNSQNTVSWNAVPGAIYYNVYRGTGSSTMTQVLQTTTTSIVDNGTLNWQSWNSTPYISNANPTVALPAPLRLTNSVIYNNYLYVVGGYNNGNVNSVYYAKINNDGTLNAWNIGNTLPFTENGGFIVAYNGYIYDMAVCGTDYYYAPLRADGSTGSWTDATSYYPIALEKSTGFINNGYLYTVGGRFCGTGNAAQSAVYYSKINTDGTLGAVTTNTNALPSTEYWGWTVANNGYVYYTGGTNGTTSSTSIYYAKINLDGSIGTWTTYTESFRSGFANNITVIYQGYIYILLPCDYTIWFAKLNPDGSFGTWLTSDTSATTSDILAPYQTCKQADSISANGYIYIIGGTDGASAQMNDVYYAKVNPPMNSSGTLNALSTNASTLPQTIDRMYTTTYNGYLYSIGGFNGTNYLNTVYYAKINTDGTLGSWVTSSSTLPQNLADMTGVVFNGYIYIFGGNNNGTAQNTVYYAPLSATGAVGSWTTSANTLPSAVYNATTVICDQALYVMGGNNGSSTVNTTYYQLLNTTDGSIGTWTTSSTTLPANLQGAESICTNGYIYLMGGYTGTSYPTTVYNNNVNGTTGAPGTWGTDANALNYGAAYGSAYLYDNDIYLIGGLNGSGAISSVEFTNQNSYGYVTSWTTTSSILPQGIYNTSNTSVISTEGYFYFLGGYTGSSVINTIYSGTLSDPLVVPSSNTATTFTNTINLTWTPVSNATGYKIYRGTSTGTENAYVQINNGKASSFTDIGQSFGAGTTTTGSISAPTLSTSTPPVGGTIPYNTKYYYEISSLGASGEGNPSTEVNATANGTIGTPSNLSVSTTSVSSSTISANAWVNSPNVNLGASISSPSGTDSLILLVEVEPLSVSFAYSGSSAPTIFSTTGSGIYQSQTYAYSGSPVNASIAILSLSPSTQYHWQALVEGNGGNSTWVSMGGSPDFGIDSQAPTIQNTDKSQAGMNAIGWSSQPTQLLSDGFESGTILTSDTPAGKWNGYSTSGSAAHATITTNTLGQVHKGTYSANMTTTASTQTTFISTSNTKFNVNAIEMTTYIYLNSLTLTGLHDKLDLIRFGSYSANASISKLFLYQTGNGVVIDATNEVNVASGIGTIRINTGQWYALTLSVNITTGTVTGYVNGVQDTSLTGQNLGVTNIGNTTYGIHDVSGSDFANIQFDDINVENTSGLTQLTNGNTSPYGFTTPYFEWFGEQDGNGSGIASYNTYFGTSSPTSPSANQSANTYTSATLSTAGMYYLSLTGVDNTSNTSLVNNVFLYNFMINPSPYNPTNLAQNLVSGAISAGSYYYEVTALTASGETTASSEVSVTDSGSTSENSLVWNAVPGATGYKVYKGTTTGGENTYYQTTNTSLLDTGSLTFTSGSLPGSNTATTSTNTISITWSNITGATGYKIYEGSSSNGENQYIQVNNGNTLSFVDTGQSYTAGSTTTGTLAIPSISGSTNAVGGSLAASLTRYYKVSAINASGESSPSTETTIITNATIAVPSGVSITQSSTASTASTSWSTQTNTPLTITNTSTTTALPIGYTITDEIDSFSGISSSNVHVIYWNGSTNTELDRDYQTDSLTGKIYARFELQASIAASGSDTTHYRIYFGTLGNISVPLANLSNVYVHYTDFTKIGSGNTWDSAYWGTEKSCFTNTTAGIQASVTGFSCTQGSGTSYGAGYATETTAFVTSFSGGSIITKGGFSDFTGANQVQNQLIYSDTTHLKLSYTDRASSVGVGATIANSLLTGTTYDIVASNPTTAKSNFSYDFGSITSNSTDVPTVNQTVVIQIYTTGTDSLNATFTSFRLRLAIDSEPTATNGTVQSFTNIASGTWISTSTLSITGSLLSPLNPDTEYMMIEVEPNGTSFTYSGTSAPSSFVTTGVGVYESTSYNATGGTVIGSVNLNGLASNTQYHWQALVQGLGGNSSWVSMGGTPDFGIDISSPQMGNGTQTTHVIGYSSQPPLLFKDGLESGTILKTDTPAGAWDTKAGTTTPTVVNNIQGTSLQGANELYEPVTNSGTDHIASTSFNTTSSYNVQMTVNIYIAANTYTGGCHLNLLNLIGTGDDADVTLTFTSTSSMQLGLWDGQASKSSSGSLGTITTGKWYTLTFSKYENSTNGTMYEYINGVQDASIVNFNTGTNTITTANVGSTFNNCSSGNANIYFDNVRLQDMTNISKLTSNTATPYSWQLPYFEWYGENDANGSGISTENVSFSTNPATSPTAFQTNQYYSSSTISTAGSYYLSFSSTDNVGNTSVVSTGFIFNYLHSQSAYTPGALNQYKNDAITSLANGAWTGDGITNNLVFTFTMTSPNPSDTLTPKIELEPTGTSFTGTPNFTGTPLSFTGSQVTGTVTATGLTNCNGYKWQAFIANASGTTTPVLFNASIPNVSVTNISPTATSIYDGLNSGVETNGTTSLTTITGNWAGFTDGCSGLTATPYQVGIGTTSGGTDILSYTQTGITQATPNTFSNTSFTLQSNKTYFVSVKATNNAGLTTIATSSGQIVYPSLSFSITGVNQGISNLGAMNTTTINTTGGAAPFGNFLSGVNVAAQQIQTATNAANGYTVTLQKSNVLTSGTDTIPDISSSTTWINGTTTGLGVNVVNGTNGDANTTLFTGNTLFTPIPTNANTLTVASKLTNTTGVGDIENISFQIGVPSSQPSGNYATTLSYTIIPSF